MPQWFIEIDTAKKGEDSRADFLKYRMKSFEELDANKDGKLSIDEFLKVAEPPFSGDVPGGPNLEERRTRARYPLAVGRCETLGRRLAPRSLPPNPLPGSSLTASTTHSCRDQRTVPG